MNSTPQTHGGIDLALELALEDGSDTSDVTVGDEVTWTITVTNEGDVAADDIVLLDRLPSGLELDDTDWTVDGAGNARYGIDEVLEAGESMTVDVTTTVVDGSDLDNVAEIESAVPVGVLGVVLEMPSGELIPDLDLVAGVSDRLDVASVALAATSAPVPGALAFTGRTMLEMVLAALLLVGMGLVLIVRRRDEFTITPN